MAVSILSKKHHPYKNPKVFTLKPIFRSLLIHRLTQTFASNTVDSSCKRKSHDSPSKRQLNWGVFKPLREWLHEQLTLGLGDSHHPGLLMTAPDGNLRSVTIDPRVHRRKPVLSHIQWWSLEYSKPLVAFGPPGNILVASYSPMPSNYISVSFRLTRTHELPIQTAEVHMACNHPFLSVDFLVPSLWLPCPDLACAASHL